MLHTTNTDTHTSMSIHPYEYMHARHTLMSTFETLGQLDLEIHEVSQRASHCRWERRLPLKE
jgi:protein subunit release factor B